MRLLRGLFLLVLLGGRMAGPGLAQTVPAVTPAAAATLAPKRQLRALRITEPVKLDGVLDEAAWQAAPVATDLIQNRPNPGPHEKQPTEIRILYDDANLYVGAVMHDISPDSILREMGTRDGFGNTDFIGVFFDKYPS